MSSTIASCAQARQRQRSIQLRLENQLNEELQRNKSTLIVLNLPHTLAVWIEHKRQAGLRNEQISDAFSQLEPTNPSLPELIFESTGYKLVQDHTGTVIGAAMEGRTLKVIIEDFKRSGNLLGKYRITQGNGRYYAVFQGNHRLRSLVKGTRYLTSNPLVINLGISSPVEMLKGAAKSNVFITLIISGGSNGIKWIFQDNYLLSHFITNVSIDVLKGCLALLAGVATSILLAKATTSVIVAKTFGLMVAIGVGVALSFISNENISDTVKKMAQEIALAFVTTYDTLTSPMAFASETKERAKDLVICSATATGALAISEVEAIVRDNIDRQLRQFLNPTRRLY